MIPITKGAEPPSLTARRRAGQIDWNVTGAIKNDIRRACRIEQSDLCAFCCARLPGDPQLQRIAHVEPQDVNPARTLDYTNMVLSCSSGRDYIRESTQSWGSQSCDERQKADVLPVHPLQPDCTDKFIFLGNGSIAPSQEDSDAQTSIDILNLNCERLRLKREGAIDGAEEARSWMTQEEWDATYIYPKPPHLPDFWPAISSQHWDLWPAFESES